MCCCLSHLLFHTYSIDIPIAAQKPDVILFASETMFVSSNACLTDCQLDVTNISFWLQYTKLTVNTNKNHF